MTLRFISSSRIDSLLDEFNGELILLKSIPPGIDETDCDPEEEIRLIAKLLYNNSSPQEIDLFLTFDGLIPLGIDSDDSDSEGDNILPERLLHDDPIPLPNILDFSNVAEAIVVTSPTAILDPVIESDPEVEPSEALPSPDYALVSHVHVLASPDYHPKLDTESEPIKDDAPKAVEPLPTQTVRRHHPLRLGYRAAIARWNAAPLSTPYLSYSSEYSTSLFGSSTTTPSLPHSGPSRMRSRHVSSSSLSSGNLPTPSGQLPRRRLASTSTVLSYLIADRLPPRKSPPVHHGKMVVDRLDEQSEMIRGMYEHLLDMSLSKIEETEEELQTLRAKMASSERGITSLRVRVRAEELSDGSSRVSLGIARTILEELRS
nr:hypothetical protein [Tanacetum cinerariifolium]